MRKRQLPTCDVSSHGTKIGGIHHEDCQVALMPFHCSSGFKGRILDLTKDPVQYQKMFPLCGNNYMICIALFCLISEFKEVY